MSTCLWWDFGSELKLQELPCCHQKLHLDDWKTSTGLPLPITETVCHTKDRLTTQMSGPRNVQTAVTWCLIGVKSSPTPTSQSWRVVGKTMFSRVWSHNSRPVVVRSHNNKLHPPFTQYGDQVCVCINDVPWIQILKENCRKVIPDLF